MICFGFHAIPCVKPEERGRQKGGPFRENLLVVVLVEKEGQPHSLGDIATLQQHDNL